MVIFTDVSGKNELHGHNMKSVLTVLHEFK